MNAEAAPVVTESRFTSAQMMRLAIRVFLALFVLGLLWQVWSWAQSAEAWPVRQVRVEGELHHTSQAQMAKALDDQVSKGFLALSNRRVAQAAVSLPWVRSVQVHKVWPDTLVVQVVEHVAVARWNEGDLLNEYGDRFSPQTIQGMEKLPQLSGPDGHERQLLQAYADLIKPLQGLGVPVQQLQQSDHGALRVVSGQGLVIELGKTALIGRLIETVSHLKQLGDEAFGQIKSLDMRYPNGVAVGWKKGYRPQWQPQKDPTVARGLARIGQV